MRGERASVRVARMPGNSARSKRRLAVPRCRAPTGRRNLIYDAGALTDKPLAHPVQRLQVEQVGRLGRDELYGWALHGLSDLFRIAIVVLLTFGILAHTYFGGISRAS